MPSRRVGGKGCSSVKRAPIGLVCRVARGKGQGGGREGVRHPATPGSGAQALCVSILGRQRERCRSALRVALSVAARRISSMRTRHVNLLTALVAVLLFSFSCFCISRMTHNSKRRLASLASFSPPGLRGSGMTGEAGSERRGETY